MISFWLLLHVNWALAGIISRPSAAAHTFGASNISAELSNWAPSCVNTTQSPEFAGRIDYNACAYALGEYFSSAIYLDTTASTSTDFEISIPATMKMKTAITGHNERIFFSRQYIPNPPDDTWGLPSGIDHGKSFAKPNT